MRMTQRAFSPRLACAQSPRKLTFHRSLVCRASATGPAASRRGLVPSSVALRGSQHIIHQDYGRLHRGRWGHALSSDFHFSRYSCVTFM